MIRVAPHQRAHLVLLAPLRRARRAHLARRRRRHTARLTLRPRPLASAVLLVHRHSRRLHLVSRSRQGLSARRPPLASRSLRAPLARRRPPRAAASSARRRSRPRQALVLHRQPPRQPLAPPRRRPSVAHPPPRPPSEPLQRRRPPLARRRRRHPPLVALARRPLPPSALLLQHLLLGLPRLRRLLLGPRLRQRRVASSVRHSRRRPPSERQLQPRRLSVPQLLLRLRPAAVSLGPPHRHRLHRLGGFSARQLPPRQPQAAFSGPPPHRRQALGLLPRRLARYLVVPGRKRPPRPSARQLYPRFSGAPHPRRGRPLGLACLVRRQPRRLRWGRRLRYLACLGRPLLARPLPVRLLLCLAPRRRTRLRRPCRRSAPPRQRLPAWRRRLAPSLRWCQVGTWANRPRWSSRRDA